MAAVAYSRCGVNNSVPHNTNQGYQPARIYTVRYILRTYLRICRHNKPYHRSLVHMCLNTYLTTM